MILIDCYFYDWRYGSKCREGVPMLKYAIIFAALR